jgi:hypothetical protein
METVKAKYFELLGIVEDINLQVLKLSLSRITFSEKISVQVKFSDPELCFNNLISWLYIFVYEATGRNLDFILKKIISYNIGVSPAGKNINKHIHAFRTVLQHNLDLTNSESDIEKQNLCNSWFYEKIGKNAPITDEEWIECLSMLLQESIELYIAVSACINRISRSEHLDIVLDEWEKIISRNYSIYDYEKILIKVLKNLDLNNFFNPNLIAKKYKDEWRKDIELLPDGFNFEIEAYKIIERFLLKRDIIPIDGNDLISIGVKPGRKLMELLIMGRELFYKSPCNKEALLSQIQKIISV